MHNRETIRWAPFESIFHTKEVLSEIELQKQIHPKPILSEEEIEILEKKILEAIHTQSTVKVTYYYKGLEYSKIGKITRIQSSKLFFDDHSSLYFEQILNLQIL